jgi:hypothetical protein
MVDVTAYPKPAEELILLCLELRWDQHADVPPHDLLARYPKIRSALRFQLVTVPSNALLTIASFDVVTTAAR